jgi:Domain of unknown function (DUF4263)
MADAPPGGIVVRSRATREKRVSKIEPVELYRSTHRVITFMGIDVARTKGPELHGKLVERDAKDHEVIHAAITLPPASMVTLAEVLNSIDAVREAGTVVVIPAEGEAPVGQLRDIVNRLASHPTLLDELDEDTITKLDSGLHEMRRLAAMRAALGELDALLDGGVGDEAKYQDWCWRNGWAFGIEYRERDQTRTIAAEDRVDILMPRLTGYRDVIELKRADTPPVLADRERGTWYWSSEATRAISQTLRYADILAEEAEHGLRDHPEIVAYFPIGTVVMGRSGGWGPDERKWLVRLNAALHGVHVMTYDDLRAQAARMLEVVSQR